MAPITLYSPKALSLEQLPLWERWTERTFQGGREEPLIAGIQLAGQLVVMSPQLLPPTVPAEGPLQGCRLLTSLCPHVVEGVSFINALNPFMRSPPSQSKHNPNALFPDTITMGIGFQHIKWGRDTNI